MPIRLSPEEIQAQFSTGGFAEAPQAGQMDRFGAAIDRAQAGLYGIGEAIGLPTADARMANEAQQEQTMQRFYQSNPLEPQTFRDVDSFTSALKYLRGLGIDSSPELITSLLSGGIGGLAGLGTAGRLGVSALANYPAALGDILQNQREAGGRTNLGVAAALGVPYVAADMVGLEGALASGRMMRTGIKALDEMKGLKGGLARTGANVGLNAPVEGASETFQEGVNQIGQMAVSPRTEFLSPDAQERYLESFVGGAALGGAASGLMGGWRRSEGYQPDTSIDLMAPKAEAPVQATPSVGLVTEPTPLQQRINEQLGIGARATPKNYIEQFKAAYDEPSGQFATDKTTGVERQLTMGELVRLQSPELDLTQSEPAKTAAAASMAATAERDPVAQTMRDTFGVVPTPSAMALYNEIQASGIPVDSDILMDVWKYAGDKPMTLKRLEKARLLLDEAIIKARAPAAQTTPTVAPAVAPAAPAPAVAAPAAAVAPTPNVAQAPQTIQAEAQGQAPAAPAAAAPTTVDPQMAAAWDDHRDEGTPSFDQLPANMQQTWSDAVAAKQQNPKVNLYKIAEELTAEGVSTKEDPRRALLNQIFGGRDGEIIFDVVGEGMSQQAAADKYGMSRAAVEKIVGSGVDATNRRNARIQRAMESGITKEQIVEALKPTAGVTDENSLAIRNMFSGISVDPLMAQEAGMEGIIGTVGGSEANTGAKLNDVEKKLFALLEQRATTSDEATLAEIDSELAKITDLYKDLEAKEQAKVRETAGKKSEKTAAEETAATAEQPAELGAEDAVQVESPAEVSVRQGAEAGQRVGKQVRRAEKPAGEGQALTESEQAAQAWDKVAAEYPTAPKFADLTKDQQETFTEYGPDNWTKDDVDRELVKLAKSGAKFGKTADDVRVVKAKNPYTAKALLADIKDFIRADIPGRKLMIVDSVEDLLRSSDKAVRAIGAALAIEGAYGVAANGKAYLIANRIEVGAGRAKFMHEVGAHLGLENLLPKAVYDRLTDQLMEWAKKDDGSIESELVLNAIERVQSAGTPKEDRRAEMLAYFIEEAMEAGIDPTATAKEAGPLNSWFRTLWAAFKVAVRKLGFKPESMTAQDVVNLAFGAARLEINGTWHGTAAAFRKFNNKFIGSGEGATAYGWGTYLAQRIGIAKGYWSADISRKTRSGADVTFDGKPLVKVLADLRKDNSADAQVIGMAVSAVYERTVKNSPSPVYAAGADLNDALSDKSLSPAERKQVGAAYQLLNDLDFVNRFTEGTPVTPEGSLKRVDTAVADDRVFDYDKPVIKQSEYIADKLMALLDPHADDIVDRTNKDVEELTGRDLIGSGENDLGLLSQLIMDDYISPTKPDAQFDRAVQQGKFHEAASHLLRTLGIDGIKFLDARSRGTATEAINYDGRTYNRDELRDQVRKYRETDPDKAMVFNLLRDILRNGMEETKAALEAKVAEYEQSAFATAMQSAARYRAPTTQEQARAEAKEYVKKNVYQAKQLAWLNDNAKAVTIAQLPKTRNLIVFDDKNIFRVGSEVAADRQRMKFGKNGAAPQGLIDRNINKLPKDLRQPAKNIVGAMGDLVGRGLDYVVFTNDLIGRAVNAGMPAARRFASALAASKSAAAQRERAIEKIADMYATIEDAHKGSGAGSVNEFLFESTRLGKWGYGKFRDAEVGAMFDALGPKAQEFVKAVFKHGDTMLSEKKRIVTEATTSEYDAMIAIAKRDGDKDKLAKLKAEKIATLDRFQSLFKIRDGLPYAPIKRSGAWAVVSKSAEYEKAVADGDTKKIRELEKSPDHYQVSFVDSKWEARTLEAKIGEAFPSLSTGIVKRAQAMDEFSGQALLPAITSLRAKVDEDTGSRNANVLHIISQLYLESLAEASARKTEMRRRGISGEVDMLSSFTTQGRADANFLSSVEFSPEIQESLQQMRSQSKMGDVTRRSELFDELSSRYVGSLDYSVNPWVNKLTSLSSKYFLATSPGYYVQNLTQPFMMSVPAMAGKHDYTKVGKYLWNAYSELGPLFENTKLFDQQFDFSQVPNDVKAAVDELVKRGKIDIGLATEINEYKVDSDAKLTQFAQKLNKGMRLAVQKTEAINRLSTAMAAYRLELERTKDKAAAIEYADRILTETHGDYTAFNAPRIFNSNFGKIALQFRKFQLVQIAFYAKMFREAFNGSPAEKKAAMRSLGFALSHAGVFAGALGLPGYAAVAAIASVLFGDDDEPYDLTEEMRKALGPEWSQLVMRGTPTLIGMDLSGKIGYGNMLSIAPFQNIDLTTQAGVYQAIGALAGGAAGGMTAKMADGLAQMMSGDIYRGLESTMPKGVADMLKAGRIATGGLTRRNGDVLLGSDDVSEIGQFWAALGMPSAQVAETYQKQQYNKDLETNFADRSTKIRNQYTKAARERDTAAMADARSAWTKLQAARKNNGLKPQPLSSLLSAPRDQRLRESKTAKQLSQ